MTKTANAGLFEIQTFALPRISLLVAMTLFLTATLASALGTFLGNLILAWFIGAVIQRHEEKKAKLMAQANKEYMDAVQKEVERMQKYAKLEG